MNEDKLETARRLLKGLLDRMGIEVKVDASLKGEELYMDVIGDQKGILIGKHGRTLDSLQLLINRMVNKRMEDSVKIFLDINHYKAKRAESLTKMADHLGERVKKSGKPFTVGPLNPHDRRIIHMALSGDSILETESLGEGEMKKVRIIPKNQTT